MRILAAMSGGVDSSVAAALLAAEGHEVIGVSLQLVDESRGGEVSRCCSQADIRDARRVAGALGIPHYVINEEASFDREVVDPFLQGYRDGRTPNPCVRCNSTLKFGSLSAIARAVGADRIATGHYARVRPDETTGRRSLLRGRDRSKDQSYFLFNLDDAQLAAALFPLGDLTKAEVYALAERFRLPVAGKPESQDLCFVPGGDVRAYLRRRLGERRPGDIVDVRGRVLGRHDGVHEFTIGQRRGLGVSAPRPLYVLALEPVSNRVVVGEEDDQYSAELTATGCRLREPGLRGVTFRAEVRIRSRHDPAPATIASLAGERLHIRFDAAQRAVTPGQAVVLYGGDVVLGGGWIEAAGLASQREPPVGCTEVDAERA